MARPNFASCSIYVAAIVTVSEESDPLGNAYDLGSDEAHKETFRAVPYAAIADGVACP